MYRWNFARGLKSSAARAALDLADARCVLPGTSKLKRNTKPAIHPERTANNGGWLHSQMEKLDAAGVACTGGSGKHFVIVSLLVSPEPPQIAGKQKGDGCTQVGRAGIMENGRHGSA
ncbi:hypothetical protein ACSFEV_20910 [Pseudomonas fulva]|uniref:hypothetical protein n=1 Tax=Pseudomonas putida group TaxID=136845 RepID=UPI0015F69C08|nr:MULTISPECIES: hypothetical protein [Pseudomonas putida group]MBF8728533.1 hypothetical protein [Pseudomonas putida]